jgi:hypothetical protein
MTFYDYLSNNPWVVYVFIIVVVLFIILLIVALREGREISFFNIFKIGSKEKIKNLKDNEELKKILDEASKILDNSLNKEYLGKLDKIREKLPIQTIDIIALRSNIHHLLLEIAIDLHGGFAGIGYPGRNLYAEFSPEFLANMLPDLLDLKDNRNTIQEKIKDFYSLSEKNVYGVQIPDDEFTIAVQLGIFIVIRLEKLKKMIQGKIKNELDPRSYIEEELERYNKQT